MGHILAAIGLSDRTDPVIDHVARFSKAFNSPVTLLHVAAPNPAFVGTEVGPQSVHDARSELLRNENSELHGHAEKLKSLGIEVETLLIEGDYVETIVREANRRKVDLIIAGSHGHSAIYDVLFGSVSEGVIRTADCPVLVIPQTCASSQ